MITSIAPATGVACRFLERSIKIPTVFWYATISLRMLYVLQYKQVVMCTGVVLRYTPIYHGLKQHDVIRMLAENLIELGLF